MKDQFENLLAPDGLLTRFLYLVLFAVIFCLCRFILIALVIFQFLHLVLTAEKNEKVTEFAADFSAYLGAVSAYLTLASDDQPFPFRDWGGDTPQAPAEAVGSAAETEQPADPAPAPQKKAAAKKKTVRKKAAKKTSRKTTKKKTTKK